MKNAYDPELQPDGCRQLNRLVVGAARPVVLAGSCNNCGAGEMVHEVEIRGLVLRLCRECLTSLVEQATIVMEKTNVETNR